ncbi:MAG TPA: BadF/BadG/BcrA/BcrD ATPase family protein [Trebonia sp.]|jgi:N-acetylglucosamine kinase-like BadF-type ATPase|nr:BadF/BadG/BcrA/BcrD ATPase family protein [Trebonia sp.]
MAEDRDSRRAAVLAIDGGNSKSDVALVADDGTLLASVRGPGASHEEFGLDEAMRRLGELVRIAHDRANGSAGGLVARHTSACLAGADLPAEEAQLAAAIQGQGWSLTSAVANDTFAVLRAGLTPGEGERPWGVAVTCGAGINCVGVAPDGRTTRFLSFGTLSGDWGGGQGLGREVIWWAMRAEDGRGQPTALRAAVATFYGMPSVHDVAVAFHLGHLAEDDILGLPAVLFATASDGDEVALSLVERQAEEIAAMAMTAMRRLDLDGGPAIPVVLGGGVLEARNPQLTDAITRRLAVLAPGGVPRIVDTPPVTGAALLGLDYLGGRSGPAAEARLRATSILVTPGL